METAGPFSWNAGPFPSGASPDHPSRHLRHFQNPAKTKSTSTLEYLYVSFQIQFFINNVELKKDKWPFLNLHLPPRAGLPVHLQVQHPHSSLSYASCASCVSYLFYASFPSSFSSSFHCHQHLKSGITNLLLVERQSKSKQQRKIQLPSLFNFSRCPEFQPCLGIDSVKHCRPFWLAVGMHWPSEAVTGKQMQQLDVWELRVEVKPIERKLFWWAEDLDMVCERTNVKFMSNPTTD